MKVLLAASEVAPIIKIGGLGDVAGSLPRALMELGIDVDVIVPFFPFAKTQDLKLIKLLEFLVPFEGRSLPVTVFKTKLPGSDVDVLLIESKDFFSKAESNYFANNMRETTLFAFFSKAIVEYVKNSFNTYDIIHCNDWHTGTVPVLLRDELENDRPSTLMTIHNIMYQGTGDKELVRSIGLSPGDSTSIDYDIEDGTLNMMQQGVSTADFVNTVSETYAHEIMTPEYGGGLEELLVGKEGRVSGILNGINYADFPKNYSEKNWKKAKAALKNNLLKKFNLPRETDRPLMSFIGRLDPGQKGIDLIYDTAELFVENNATMVVMGKGVPAWESAFIDMGKDSKYSKHISPQIKFDLQLAIEIYSASDFILIPSKYEPCGLVQMIGMWYGAVPIAHSTGGLKDSIVDGETGILFEKFSLESYKEALSKAFSLYANDRKKYERVVESCMAQDFSWTQSAKKYRDLYQKIVKIREED